MIQCGLIAFLPFSCSCLCVEIGGQTPGAPRYRFRKRDKVMRGKQEDRENELMSQ